MSREEEWAAHLDPTTDPTADDQDTLNPTERAAIDRIGVNLADAVLWDEPPASVFDRVLAEAVGIPADQAADVVAAADVRRVESKARPRWTRSLTAVAAAVLAIGLAMWSVWDGPRVEGQTFELAATELVPQATATVRPERLGGGFEIWARFDGLAPARDGEYYAGWLVGENGMVPVGSFHARSSDDPVILWSGVDIADHPDLLITLQRSDEPATPSSEVLFTGRIAP